MSFFDKEAKYIAVIEKLMEKVLVPQGFYSDGKAHWRRDRDWKVEFVYFTEGFREFCISFSVDLPISSEGPLQSLAFNNLGYIAGLGTASSPYPGLFQSMRKWQESFEADLRCGLNWLDQFDTPEACLQELRRDHITRIRPGSPAYVAIETYLNKLIDSEND